jgi:hypothetical protein
MRSGIVNAILGAVGIVLGLNGYSLVFTRSSTALIAGGVGVLALGLWQIWRDHNR